MPTYEFRCPECHLTWGFEVGVSAYATTVFLCPDCGAQMARVFTPPGVILKGKGFYSTDNRPRRKESEART
jgi:putative FmdB family regulatory protein